MTLKNALDVARIRLKILQKIRDATNRQISLKLAEIQKIRRDLGE